jgi:hypothetical protein
MPKGSKTGRWIGHEEITGVFYGQYRHDAKRKGRDFEVSIEELWNQWLAQDGKCIYTGRQLVHGVDASIDRIDSSLGYTIDNIQWVHRDINRMKSDFNAEYFIQLCGEVSNGN